MAYRVGTRCDTNALLAALRPRLYSSSYYNILFREHSLLLFFHQMYEVRVIGFWLGSLLFESAQHICIIHQPTIGLLKGDVDYVEQDRCTS